MRTAARIFKKFLEYLLLFLLITLGTFLLSSMIPGDYFTVQQLDPSVSREAIARLRATYAFDQPVAVQYAHWLLNLVRLDFGQSLAYGAPVRALVWEALCNTLWIGLPALVIGIGSGITLGTFHALRLHRAAGRTLDLISTIGLSLPSLVLGLAALLLAARTGLFPLGGMSAAVPPGDASGWLLDRLRHLLLPVACLVLPVTASVERIHCAAASENLSELYLRAARARGIGRVRLLSHYLIRPSLNPVLSTSGPIAAAVLSGSLVVEVLFSWPGLGQVTYHALFSRDVFLLLGCVTAGSVLLIAANIAADLLLRTLDPRTRETARRGAA